MDGALMPLGLDTATTRLSLNKLATQSTPGETAKKFQSVLATMLVKEMRRAVPEGFFGDGASGDIYSGWLDDHVGQSLAEQDALHMRAMIEKSVLQKSEVPA